MGKDADEEAMELAASEHRSGLDLWHRFDTVVVLSLNVRSGGVLGDLLQELRDGPLSDASWSILEERLLGWYRQDGVLTPLPSGRIDPRLQKPPFSNNVVHFVVARHKIRAAQAFHNAMATASRLGVPVFVVKALDVAKQEEAHLFTEQWHTKLLWFISVLLSICEACIFSNMRRAWSVRRIRPHEPNCFLVLYIFDHPRDLSADSSKGSLEMQFTELVLC